MTDTQAPVRIALLGSTGSIGTQTLEVVDHHPGRFEVVALAAGRRHDLLATQVEKYRPKIVVADGASSIAGVPALPSPEGLVVAATHPDVDIVIVATSGHAAIPAVMAAIEAGKTIALANKETLVCAGELITPLARAHGARIRTVDSEHSAIWQALGDRNAHEATRLILTASGGPFRTTPLDELANATVSQALAHPNFAMGGKITIDSATMMNKGLEIIEARWLFDMPLDRIDVVIHPQQIIHSMVEFPDGSVLAQMGTPDMRLPIQYALTAPEHCDAPGTRLDFSTLAALTFEMPDLDKFPSLRIAREAGIAGKTFPTVLSAADEVAVDAFVHGKLTFLGIPRLVETVLAQHDARTVTSLDVVLDADRWAREEAQNLLQRYA